MKRCLTLLISLMIWPCLGFAALPVFVTDIQTIATPSFTRITFLLTDKARGRVRSFNHPGRIEIEFANTYLRTPFQKKQYTHANITRVRQVWSKSNSLKFVLLLRENVHWKTRYVSAPDPNLIRLQIDIESNHTQKNPQKDLQRLFQEGVDQTFYMLSAEVADRETSEQALVMQEPVKQESVKPEPAKLEVVKSEPVKSVKPIVITQVASKPEPKPIDYEKTNQKPTITIVLDAGHGGKDPGASGNHGTKEKDVVLRIAKMLAAEINKQPNRRAVLTRQGDYFVPLRKRLKLARRGKADLFIAIHADAHYNRDATGSSVYVLSSHGASSEAARWLANRENYAELGTVALNQLVDTDPVLRSVMVDLAQTATIDASLRLGQRVLDALDDISKLHHNDVERAPFVVLKSPDIPSILIETGFITNPTEESRLKDPAYQRQLVNAMRQGIENYLN